MSRRGGRASMETPFHPFAHPLQIFIIFRPSFFRASPGVAWRILKTCKGLITTCIPADAGTIKVACVHPQEEVARPNHPSELPRQSRQIQLTSASARALSLIATITVPTSRVMQKKSRPRASGVSVLLRYSGIRGWLDIVNLRALSG